MSGRLLNSDVTSWLRGRKRALAFVALLAMALQIVGSFAHVHVPKPVGISAGAQFASSVIDADRAAVAEADQRPARHDGDGLCPLCLAGHLVASAITPSAPLLALPVAYASVERSVSVVQSQPTNIATFFWSRGPPQS